MLKFKVVKQFNISTRIFFYSYCHRRSFLTSERLISKKRYVHTSVTLQEKEHTEHCVKDELPEENTLLKAEDESFSKTVTREKPVSDLTTNERLKPPRPVINVRHLVQNILHLLYFCFFLFFLPLMPLGVKYYFYGPLNIFWHYSWQGGRNDIVGACLHQVLPFSGNE